MRVRVTSTVLLFVGLALAGCASEAEPADEGNLRSVEKAQFDEETGAVEGLVLNTEELPVSGAQVGIQELEKVTVADEQGRFAMSHVEPGSYQLFAQAIGFESVGQRIEVRPGEVTNVQLHLSALAIVEPYSTQVIQDGLFGCGASWWPPDPVLGVVGIAACGVFGNAPVVGEYDEFLLNWEVERDIVGWNGSVFEMSWESNQIAGRGMTMRWEVCANNAATQFTRIAGVSPLRTYADAAHVHRVVHNSTYNDDACGAAEDACNEDHCAFISRVFSTPQTTGSDVADVGVTFQQRYTKYHSAFFYEPGALDFTAIGDG